MVLFWIFAGLVTAATVIAIVRPVVRALTVAADPARGGEAAVAADVAVYRDQLAEVDTDLKRGLVTEAEAEAARAEIARRLLAKVDGEAGQAGAGRAGSAVSPTHPVLRKAWAFYVLAAAVPLVALPLYLAQGSPWLPGMPAAERLARAPAANAQIDELVARVEARLRENPVDGQGWEVIAPVYLKMERFRDAVEAFRKAILILGESPQRLSGLAEAVVLANDGVVTEEARLAYKRLLALDENRLEARFGLALALEQDGDLQGAEKAYRTMLEQAPADAPWRPFVTERLEALAGRTGASPAPPVGSKAGTVPAGGDAIAALPEGERRQAIVQMVEALAEKLKSNGRDTEGWQRLIRSWLVLGEAAKAEAALSDARKALVGDEKALSEINAFAKQLGLKS